jgi:crossover junction endodeoxyribonuclease RuvC
LKQDRIILGIDPGTNIMGYGVIHQKGNKIILLTMGVLKLGGYSNHPIKLRKIFERTLSLIKEYHPDELAIEAPFMGKNPQSMLKLGRAQGVAMAAGLYRNVPIFEYAPRKIKQSITGKGTASKQQIAAMLKHILAMSEEPEYLDATDGLAVAVCHYMQKSYGDNNETYNDWAGFVKKNPDKVK